MNLFRFNSKSGLNFKQLNVQKFSNKSYSYYGNNISD